MKKIIHLSLLGTILSVIPTVSRAADAQSFTDRFDVGGRLTFQYIGEDNDDLGTSGTPYQDSFSEQFQLLVGADLAEDYKAFFHGRALNIDGETGFDDDDGSEISVASSFLELRELYVVKENLLGKMPLSLQVGRQRVQEPRALWWNSDNDLVRLRYKTTLLSGFIAAGEDLTSYRNNTNSDFRRDDEDRFRVLGETSWQYNYNQFLEGRFLHENDHSGTPGIGETVPTNDRDVEDQTLTWAGVRATGRMDFPSVAFNNLAYRVDLVGLAGEESQSTTVGGLNSALRTVTGTNNRDVLAWALDAGLTVDPFTKGGTLFVFDYAFASGDDGSGTNHGFRQTDLQGSSSRIGLERQQQRNYGEVLRPELSNLHILSAGLAHPLTDATDVGITYFRYHLDEEALSLRSSGINAGLNGTDRDVGEGVDVFLNVDLDDEFGTKPMYIDGMNLRIVGGAFMPGDAYENNNDNNVHKIVTELKFIF